MALFQELQWRTMRSLMGYSRCQKPLSTFPAHDEPELVPLLQFPLSQWTRQPIVRVLITLL